MIDRNKAQSEIQYQIGVFDGVGVIIVPTIGKVVAMDQDVNANLKTIIIWMEERNYYRILYENFEYAKSVVS